MRRSKAQTQEMLRRELEVEAKQVNRRYFKLFWKTGDVQEVSAPDAGSQLETLANAMNNAGIGGGALAALDYWRESAGE